MFRPRGLICLCGGHGVVRHALLGLWVHVFKMRLLLAMVMAVEKKEYDADDEGCSEAASYGYSDDLGGLEMSVV